MSSSLSDHITCGKYNLLIDILRKIKDLNHTNLLKIKVYEIEDQRTEKKYLVSKICGGLI